MLSKQLKTSVLLVLTLSVKRIKNMYIKVIEILYICLKKHKNC